MRGKHLPPDVEPETPQKRAVPRPEPESRKLTPEPGSTLSAESQALPPIPLSAVETTFAGARAAPGAGSTAPGRPARDLPRRREHEQGAAPGPRHRPSRRRPLGPPDRARRGGELEGGRPRRRAVARPARRPPRAQRPVHGGPRLERPPDRGGGRDLARRGPARRPHRDRVGRPGVRRRRRRRRPAWGSRSGACPTAGSSRTSPRPRRRSWRSARASGDASGSRRRRRRRGRGPAPLTPPPEAQARHAESREVARHAAPTGASASRPGGGRGRGPATHAHRPAPPTETPHTAPHDELVSVVRGLVEASPRRSVVIDAVANALKARGFQRPPGSPRLVTRLRRIRELVVSPSGTITLADVAGLPRHEPQGHDAARGPGRAGRRAPAGPAR